MWNWIRCYVTGHDYSVCCVNGAMFLRCVACGRRSQGWVVHAETRSRRTDRSSDGGLTLSERDGKNSPYARAAYLAGRPEEPPRRLA